MLNFENMRISFLTLIIILTLSELAYGGVVITDKGINNIGSMTAYIMKCETEKYIPLGTTSDFVIRIRKAFAKKNSDAIMLAYQNALHSKKIYSPSKDAWFDMQIDKKSCNSIEKVIPSLDDFMKKMANEYPN